MKEINGSCKLEKVGQVDIENFQKLEELLSILSNKTRLAILSVALEHKSVCACELQPALGLEQPTVTTHLQKLYAAGILEKKNEWRYTFYSIKNDYRSLIKRVIEKQMTAPFPDLGKDTIKQR